MIKLNLWTITVINSKGEMYFIETESKEETLEQLESLKITDQDELNICVFPPKSNLTIEELVNYNV